MTDELANIKERWWVLPDWSTTLGFVVAICSWFFYRDFAARLVATLASIYCARRFLTGWASTTASHAASIRAIKKGCDVQTSRSSPQYP